MYIIAAYLTSHVDTRWLKVVNVVSSLALLSFDIRLSKLREMSSTHAGDSVVPYIPSVNSLSLDPPGECL